MATRHPSPFDLVLVGHVTQDLLPEGGWRPGGTAAYAARVAVDLGLRVAVVTSASSLDGYEEALRGAEVFFHRSAETTAFENTYRGEHRTQRQTRRGGVLRASLLPREVVTARAVLLGPVMGEVPWTTARAFSPQTYVTACLQGWLRAVGPGQTVQPLPASRVRPESLRGLTAVFVSQEDLGGGGLTAARALAPWRTSVDHVLLTAGESGSTVFTGSFGTHIPAYGTLATDPTGAGDAFAAGFVVRYLESQNAADAAHFASAAASMMVEQVGIGRLNRTEVERRHQVLSHRDPLLHASHG